MVFTLASQQGREAAPPRSLFTPPHVLNKIIIKWDKLSINMPDRTKKNVQVAHTELASFKEEDVRLGSEQSQKVSGTRRQACGDVNIWWCMCLEARCIERTSSALSGRLLWLGLLLFITSGCAGIGRRHIIPRSRAVSQRREPLALSTGCSAIVLGWWKHAGTKTQGYALPL